MEIGLPNTMQKNKVGVARTQTRVFGNGKQWNYLFVSCQRSGYKSRNGKGEIGCTAFDYDFGIFTNFLTNNITECIQDDAMVYDD
jgi:hypothetical protein